MYISLYAGVVFGMLLLKYNILIFYKNSSRDGTVFILVEAGRFELPSKEFPKDHLQVYLSEDKTSALSGFSLGFWRERKVLGELRL